MCLVLSMVGSMKSLWKTTVNKYIQIWCFFPFPALKQTRAQPEMIIGQRFQHGDGHPLPNHQQQRDSHIMVALVVMELRVAFQDPQDDVDKLLLKRSSLRRRHSWHRAEVRVSALFTQVGHKNIPDGPATLHVPHRSRLCYYGRNFKVQHRGSLKTN